MAQKQIRLRAQLDELLEWLLTPAQQAEKLTRAKRSNL